MKDAQPALQSTSLALAFFGALPVLVPTRLALLLSLGLANLMIAADRSGARALVGARTDGPPRDRSRARDVTGTPVLHVSPEGRPGAAEV